MFLRTIRICSLLILLLVSHAIAEEVGPVYDEARVIEARGRLISEYELVLRKASELLLTGKAEHMQSGHYMALKKENNWTFFYGTLSEGDHAFVIKYSFSCKDDAIDKMKEVKIDKTPDEVLQLARAIKLSLATVEAAWPERRIMAFIEQDTSVTVYIVPENEKEDSVLLGGDTKLTISLTPDGLKIAKNETLHAGTLLVPLAAVEEGKERAAGHHLHLTSNLPTETDVALVILHPQLAPHFVVGMKWISRLNPDGTISVLGGAERMLKGKMPVKR
jgi:hypothetical protein